MCGQACDSICTHLARLLAYFVIFSCFCCPHSICIYTFYSKISAHFFFCYQFLCIVPVHGCNFFVINKLMRNIWILIKLDCKIVYFCYFAYNIRYLSLLENKCFFATEFGNVWPIHANSCIFDSRIFPNDLQIDKDISSFSIYKVFRTVFFSLGFVRVCMTIWSQIVLIHLSTWQRKHIQDSAHSPLPLAHTHNKRRKFKAQRIHKIKLSVEIHFSNIRCVIDNHCSFFIDGLVLKTKWKI